VTFAVPAALVAAAAIAALVAAGGGGEAAPPAPPQGPLGGDDETAMGVPQQAGRPFSIGLPIVYNDGDRPATIDRISLVDASEGIDVLETHIAGTRRANLMTAFTYSWPERGAYSDMHAPRGYVVPPRTTRKGRRGVELVFVLRVDEPGSHQFAGAQVDYRIGGRSYRATLWDSARVCAVRTLPRHIEPDCEPVEPTATD
jgi:hypothetical protein